MPALVGAFTATAKKDVIKEIISHLREKLSIDLESFIGGVQRENEEKGYKKVKRESWELPVVEILHRKFQNKLSSSLDETQ